MELLVIEATTTSPSYWLNWRFLLCAIWVLTSMLIGSFLIWKYEHPESFESGRDLSQQERPLVLCYNESWKPCLKDIHPVYLVVYRVIAFSLLLVALSFDVAAHGGELFFYYTQWTFTLVTIYFGFGLVLSINGCLQHSKANNSDCHVSVVVEQGLYVPLASGVNENENAKVPKGTEYPEEHRSSRTAGFCGYLFQILFQMTAGAVTITDGLYWSLIFPFLTIKDYELSFYPCRRVPSCVSSHKTSETCMLVTSNLERKPLPISLQSFDPSASVKTLEPLTVVAHSLNAILLLGDTALNCMGFPWFRISFFLWWTSIYVIFQWLLHACESVWWPYPILDLSFEYAPLWYLLVALMHIPCYAFFLLLVKLKHLALSKCFPQSYQFCP